VTTMMYLHVLVMVWAQVWCQEGGFGAVGLVVGTGIRGLDQDWLYWFEPRFSCLRGPVQEGLMKISAFSRITSINAAVMNSFSKVLPKRPKCFRLEHLYPCRLGVDDIIPP
jgi:hypothetical protein